MSVRVVDLNNEEVAEEATTINPIEEAKEEQQELIEEPTEEVKDASAEASRGSAGLRDEVKEVVKKNLKKRNPNGKHKRIEYNARNVSKKSQ